jgi:hypothetical protein
LQANITARLLCVAHLHLRQYEEAIEQCSRSLNMIGAKFQAWGPRLKDHITLSELGRIDEAF